MSANDEGGQAFPFCPSEKGWEHVPGMTLREWYAGLAMQSLIAAEPPAARPSDRAQLSRRAFDHADSMLAEGRK